MPEPGIAGDTYPRKQNNNPKYFLVLAVIAIFLVMWGASKYYGAGPPSLCDKFRGEKGLCEAAIKNVTSVMNGTVAYAVENYNDGTYKDAWMIYVRLPVMIKNIQTNESTNSMAFLFDKKTGKNYFHNSAPLGGAGQ